GGERRNCDAIISGFSNGTLTYSKENLDEPVEKALLQLMSECYAGAKSQLVNLATRLGSTELDKYTAEISATLLAKAADEKEAEAARIAAAVQAIEMRKVDAEPVMDLIKLLTVRSSPEFVAGILDALRRSDSLQVGALLVERLPMLTPAGRLRAVVVLLG